MGRTKVNHYFIPQQEDQEDRIKEMLKRLELEGIISAFPRTAAESLKTKSTYLDFLESLLEKETLYREENRVNRWTQQSKIRTKKNFKEFEFHFQPSIDRLLIRELASCRFIQEGKNVIFLGPAGVGKTHLSIALGLEAIQRGFETRFLRLDDLIDLVEKASSVELLSRFFRTLMQQKLLILDDIDFYNTGKNASVFLFKLVMQRYENKLSTIFTSNKPFTEWEDLFGSHSRASSAIDRIVERAEIINITGESYRVKDKLTHKKKT